jgi:hypothetical protein
VSRRQDAQPRQQWAQREPADLLVRVMILIIIIISSSSRQIAE